MPSTWPVVLVLVALVLTLPIAIGALLPRDHHVTRRIAIARPRAEVWARVADLERQPRWRRDLRSAIRVDDRDGHPTWVESGRETMTLETLEAEPPERLVRRIVPGGTPFGGRWTIALSDHDGVTEVAVTEDGEVYAPLFRFFSRFVLGYTRTIDGYLRMLAASFDERNARPTD
ncbi:MAG: hypothetical protein FJZ92_04350 [Chloroflexi bacterium]|nr:hypothetical protein [Chloroflexota bacterium]MBM4435410.1 hypothetical protein [Chloroflexota bacterium]